MSEFIIENGVLTKYNGKGGDVVIPDKRDKYQLLCVLWLQKIDHPRPRR